MYQQFKKYINDNRLFDKTDKLLLGISGGVDSTVLLYLIYKAQFKFEIAHCNFNLRGDESDADQYFVEQLALKFGVNCHVISFDTQNIAAQKGISIEMAARQLRYNWFSQLCSQHDCNVVVVGHHLDDVLETFMLNLSRGTGIRGLSGIKPKVGKIVRPLLFASRKDIVQFAKNNNLEFRNDSSNDDTTIKRNKVRHQIIPLFEELNTAFKRRLSDTINYLSETESIFLDRIDSIKKELIATEGKFVKIPIADIKRLKPQRIMLFELLRDYDFKSEMVDEIILSVNKPEGQIFFSSSHRLVVDRYNLIICNKEEYNINEIYYIENEQGLIVEPIEMSLSVIDYSSDYEISRKPEFAEVDIDKLCYPLLIRRWRIGDYFKPLGLNGFKKLSDFFIDQKISIPEKENTWVLLSENKVVWIIGKRIDDRFKLSANTKRVLQIKLGCNDKKTTF